MSSNHEFATMNLKENFKNISPSRVIWQSEDSQITANEINIRLCEISKCHDFYKKTVVIAVTDPIKLAHLIVLMDGLAEKMILLPI